MHARAQGWHALCACMRPSTFAHTCACVWHISTPLPHAAHVQCPWPCLGVQCMHAALRTRTCRVKHACKHSNTHRRQPLDTTGLCGSLNGSWWCLYLMHTAAHFRPTRMGKCGRQAGLTDCPNNECKGGSRGRLRVCVCVCACACVYVHMCVCRAAAGKVLHVAVWLCWQGSVSVKQLGCKDGLVWEHDPPVVAGWARFRLARGCVEGKVW